MAGGVSLTLEFSGGSEFLVGNQKEHKVNVPSAGNLTVTSLLRWLKEELLKDCDRPELLLEGDAVRPGVLVLINECDWELLEYDADDVPNAVAQIQRISFLNTPHIAVMLARKNLPWAFIRLWNHSRAMRHLLVNRMGLRIHATLSKTRRHPLILILQMHERRPGHHETLQITNPEDIDRFFHLAPPIVSMTFRRLDLSTEDLHFLAPEFESHVEELEFRGVVLNDMAATTILAKFPAMKIHVDHLSQNTMDNLYRSLLTRVFDYLFVRHTHSNDFAVLQLMKNARATKMVIYCDFLFNEVGNWNDFRRHYNEDEKHYQIRDNENGCAVIVFRSDTSRRQD